MRLYIVLVLLMSMLVMPSAEAAARAYQPGTPEFHEMIERIKSGDLTTKQSKDGARSKDEAEL